MTGTIPSLLRRRSAEVFASPSAAMPDVVGPVLLFLALVGMFGGLAALGAFEGLAYVTFLAPLGMLQAAGLAGSGVGGGLARDIEQGYIDRLLVAPIRAHAVLLADILTGLVRSIVPVVVVFVIALLLGASAPSIAGIGVVLVLTLGFGMVAAAWSTVVALRTRTESAAPMMHAPIILVLILSPAFAPRDALASWLQAVARFNPITFVVEATRAPFEGAFAWADIWPGLVVLAVLLALFTLMATSLLRKGFE